MGRKNRGAAAQSIAHATTLPPLPSEGGPTTEQMLGTETIQDETTVGGGRVGLIVHSDAGSTTVDLLADLSDEEIEMAIRDGIPGTAGVGVEPPTTDGIAEACADVDTIEGAAIQSAADASATTITDAAVADGVSEASDTNHLAVYADFLRDLGPAEVRAIVDLAGHSAILAPTGVFRAAPPVAVSRTAALAPTSLIRVLVANPKRPGSASHGEFALYREGMTVLDYLEHPDMARRRASANLRWDVNHGFISVHTPEEYAALPAPPVLAAPAPEPTSEESGDVISDEQGADEELEETGDTVLADAEG